MICVTRPSRRTRLRWRILVDSNGTFILLFENFKFESYYIIAYILQESFKLIYQHISSHFFQLQSSDQYRFVVLGLSQLDWNMF